MGLEPKKKGRPRIHPDRQAYKAMKAREYRARDKALSIPKPILPTPTKQEGDKP